MSDESSGSPGSVLPLRDVNCHLICTVCRGYYVDATTITECLHSCMTFNEPSSLPTLFLPPHLLIFLIVFTQSVGRASSHLWPKIIPVRPVPSRSVRPNHFLNSVGTTHCRVSSTNWSLTWPEKNSNDANNIESRIIDPAPSTRQTNDICSPFSRRTIPFHFHSNTPIRKSSHPPLIL